MQAPAPFIAVLVPSFVVERAAAAVAALQSAEGGDRVTGKGGGALKWLGSMLHHYTAISSQDGPEIVYLRVKLFKITIKPCPLLGILL